LKLITAHRILIGAAIAFFILYAALQLRQYARGLAVMSLVQTVAAVAVAVGLVVYYRTLSRWGK
jgi:ABC-type tungstate transport system substrate-binding protein